MSALFSPSFPQNKWKHNPSTPPIPPSFLSSLSADPFCLCALRAQENIRVIEIRLHVTHSPSFNRVLGGMHHYVQKPGHTKTYPRNRHTRGEGPREGRSEGRRVLPTTASTSSWWAHGRETLHHPSFIRTHPFINTAKSKSRRLLSQCLSSCALKGRDG